jgi:hypothetical protein
MLLSGRLMSIFGGSEQLLDQGGPNEHFWRLDELPDIRAHRPARVRRFDAQSQKTIQGHAETSKTA